MVVIEQGVKHFGLPNLRFSVCFFLEVSALLGGAIEGVINLARSPLFVWTRLPVSFPPGTFHRVWPHMSVALTHSSVLFLSLKILSNSNPKPDKNITKL